MLNEKIKAAIAEAKSMASPREQKNIETATKYMELCYTSEMANAESVKHLCAAGNTFSAPTTFPGIATLEQYAEIHGVLMKEIPDLHFKRFEMILAKGDEITLRYRGGASHSGEAHGRITPTGKSAEWTATATFRFRNGKIAEMTKDWNKLSMWEQLGWPVEECLVAAQPTRPSLSRAREAHIN